ncbi:MAG TPA: hypothetical protein VEU31_03165, partial [Candidatus Acidoferrales bacterium]|nr:hypothetical protein [Candidatus Acidoferrales bacterium]
MEESTVTSQAGTVARGALSQSPVTPLRERLLSLDLVRGVVMILMAIDHVRVYSGLPAGGPS